MRTHSPKPPVDGTNLVNRCIGVTLRTAVGSTTAELLLGTHSLVLEAECVQRIALLPNWGNLRTSTEPMGGGGISSPESSNGQRYLSARDVKVSTPRISFLVERCLNLTGRGRSDEGNARVNRELIVDAAIARYDWRDLQEANGPATRIPAAFIELIRSADPEAAQKAYWKLENHVVVQGSLFESSVGVVSLVGAALAEPARPKWVRIALLELLFQIVAGESHSDEVARGVADLGQKCRTEAKKLLWILYGIFQDGELWEAAREIILLIDDDILLAALDRLNRDNGRFDVSAPIKI